MKTKPLILASLIASTAIAATAAPQATWTPLGESTSKINENSFDRQKNGNIRVWQRDWLRPEVREKLQSDLANVGEYVDFSQYEYSLVLWEYDCLRKRYGPVAGTNYTSRGSVINSYELEEPQMRTAIPDSEGYVALTAVCSNKRFRSSAK